MCRIPATDGSTPLHAACKSVHLRIVRTLVRHWSNGACATHSRPPPERSDTKLPTTTAPAPLPTSSLSASASASASALSPWEAADNVGRTALAYMASGDASDEKEVAHR